jgi:hypothetical protein
MRRAAIAVAWIAGATVPLLLGTVFLVGCCVLPFHRTLHRIMPLCSAVANFMRGGHGDHDQAQPSSSPAREKQEPVKRIVSELPNAFRLAMTRAAQHLSTPSAASSYRSFITLGAIRCDQDVGLHLLVETFRI